MTTYIGIIEDDLLTIEAFKNHFTQYVNLQLLDCATNMKDFIRNVNKTKKTPDIIFLDIDLGGDCGIDYIQPLKKVFSEAEIIMFTGIEDSDSLIRALSSGASGYLVKTKTIEEVSQQIEIILAGGAVISPIMARKLLNYFMPNPSKDRPEDLLKPIEIQILNLLRMGMSYDAAAEKLRMKVDTLRYYIKSIYKKLNVSNKLEAINKVFS